MTEEENNEERNDALFNLTSEQILERIHELLDPFLLDAITEFRSVFNVLREVFTDPEKRLELIRRVSIILNEYPFRTLRNVNIPTSNVTFTSIDNTVGWAATNSGVNDTLGPIYLDEGSTTEKKNYDHLKKRQCYNCKKDLNFVEFKAASSDITEERAEELWQSNFLQFYCCYCNQQKVTKIIERHRKQLKTGIKNYWCLYLGNCPNRRVMNFPLGTYSHEEFFHICRDTCKYFNNNVNIPKMLRSDD